MVDDTGRKNINNRRPSMHKSAYSWWKIILASCIVSLIIQVLVPIGQSWLTDVLWRRRSKSHSLAISSPTAASTRHGQRVSYLEDPISLDQWKMSGNRNDIVRKVDGSSAWVKPPSPAIEAEALAAINAAKDARNRGNDKRCGAIIEHALALTPNHPDVLSEYGIYTETVLHDIIRADGYYALALIFSPQHSVALERREISSVIVADIDRKDLADLRRKKDEFASLPHTLTVRREMRESYFSHIFHTVAIEGNTIDLGQTRSILETGMPVMGKSLAEHNEILGMDAALRYLNRTLIDTHSITMDDILGIHRHVLGHVSPSDAGRFRLTQVYVGRFTPVGPSEVEEEMEKLVEWLNDDRTAMMEPVERAAIAHYKLVLAHPFVDGNGRTARLLMNVVLMRSGFPPVILPVEEKSEYYATLHTANIGDLRPFIRFVAKHTRATLQKYLALASTCTSDECSAGSDKEAGRGAPLRIPLE